MTTVNNNSVLTDVERYLTLKSLSEYSGLSVRTLRKALTDPLHPLPHYRRGGGKVLVRRSEFDVWMSKFRREGSDLESLVADITKGVE